MVRRPTLLNSCAMAATAAEARFRINAPSFTRRATRVVALDEGATSVISRVADGPWAGARFFSYSADEQPGKSNGEAGDIVLRGADGSTTRLSDELADADVMVMIATADDGAVAASAIGHACTQRGITTAGLIFGNGGDVRAAVSALRPHARVLMASKDGYDVSDMLTALRA
jgi:hypothetical protein